MRLYTLLRKMITKIELMWNYHSILYCRFVLKYSPSKVVTYPSGFSANTSYTSYANLFGNYLYTAVTTTKSSAWSTGNITNTTMAQMDITVGGGTSAGAKAYADIDSVGYSVAPNAYVSGLASFSSTYTNDNILSRIYTVTAVDASTNSNMTSMRYAYPTWVSFKSVRSND